MIQKLKDLARAMTDAREAIYDKVEDYRLLAKDSYTREEVCQFVSMQALLLYMVSFDEVLTEFIRITDGWNGN